MNESITDQELIQTHEFQRPNREGRSFIAAHVTKEAAKQFKILALLQDKTQQDLLIEAIEDCLLKHKSKGKAAFEEKKPLGRLSSINLDVFEEKEEMTPVSITLPISMRNDLDMRALKNKREKAELRTVSAIVRLALEQYLDRLK